MHGFFFLSQYVWYDYEYVRITIQRQHVDFEKLRCDSKITISIIISYVTPDVSESRWTSKFWKIISWF